MPRPNGSNECCYDDDGNLRDENVILVLGHPDSRPSTRVRVCNVCGCRHFEMSVDPVIVGMRGSPIGLGSAGLQFFVQEGNVLRLCIYKEFQSLANQKV